MLKFEEPICRHVCFSKHLICGDLYVNILPYENIPNDTLDMQGVLTFPCNVILELM